MDSDSKFVVVEYVVDDGSAGIDDDAVAIAIPVVEDECASVAAADDDDDDVVVVVEEEEDVVSKPIFADAQAALTLLVPLVFDDTSK